MNIALKPQFVCFAVLLAAAFVLFGGLFADAVAQTGIDFTKGDQLGNSLINWLKKNPVLWFFTAALIIVGIACALNRAPWMWMVYILIGAFVAFGATKLVTSLSKIFT